MSTATYLAEVRHTLSENLLSRVSYCDSSEDLARDWAVNFLIRMGVESNWADSTVYAALLNGTASSGGHAGDSYSVRISSIAPSKWAPTLESHTMYRVFSTQGDISLEDGRGNILWAQSGHVEDVADTVRDVLSRMTSTPNLGKDLSRLRNCEDELLVEVVLAGQRVILVDAQAVPLANLSLGALVDMSRPISGISPEFGSQTLFEDALVRAFSLQLSSR